MNEETLMNLAVDSLPLMQEGAQQAVLAAVATREQLLLKGAFAYNTWKSRARKRVLTLIEARTKAEGYLGIYKAEAT